MRIVIYTTCVHYNLPLILWEHGVEQGLGIGQRASSHLKVLFKYAPLLAWGSNSHPWDLELHALPTEPAGEPLRVCLLHKVKSQHRPRRLAQRKTWVFTPLSRLTPQVKTVRVKVGGIQKPKVARCGMDK